MIEQKFLNCEIEKMYKCVSEFQDLGNGRKRKTIVVGDSPDARTATFRFVGYVRHNWPSWKEVRFKTGLGIRTFCTVTHTVSGRPAYIFLWNELTENLWLRQVEGNTLLTWVESAINVDPRSSVGMVELIFELAESGRRVITSPGCERANLKQTRIEIRKLSLRELRQLNELAALYPLNPSAPAMAA